MEIYIDREQESSKHSFKLTIGVALALSTEDKQLIERYCEPIIGLRPFRGRDSVRTYYDGTDTSFKAVVVDRVENTLSKFNLTAHANGHDYLGSIQEFEKAVVRTLLKSIDYLKALSAWKGGRTLTSEETAASQRGLLAEEAHVPQEG